MTYSKFESCKHLKTMLWHPWNDMRFSGPQKARKCLMPLAFRPVASLVYGIYGGRYKTRTCVRGRFAPVNTLIRPRKRGLKLRSQVRDVHFQQKQTAIPFGWPFVFGGRYKTRTCDLPHVKRMRYQLRQSSFSLSAWSFYCMRGTLVKPFFLIKEGLTDFQAT